MDSLQLDIIAFGLFGLATLILGVVIGFVVGTWEER